MRRILSSLAVVTGVLVLLALFVVVFSRGADVAHASPHTILPGVSWYDTSGNLIEAHGEGMIKVGGTYYWFGEDKTNGATFQNVNCYSTTDLVNFQFVNHVLTLQPSGDLGPNRIVERPHVIYNSSTGQYVMYMHIDNTSYSERKAGVATSSSVCGNYTYRGSFKPLGNDSLDDTLFQDGANGYFVSEDRTNSVTHIYALSSDYLSVVSNVANMPHYEAPALVKVGGTYYFFGSHLTGWSTNDNQYAHSTSLSSGWSLMASFAPSGTNTCNSQTAYILPVTGSSSTTYVYLGDRWNASNLSDSRYIWLPLIFSGTTVSMTCYTSWSIDTVTGTWSTGTSPTPTPGGTSHTVVGQQSGKCLDVAGGSISSGAHVDIATCNGAAYQSWAFNALGNGYYTVVNRNSGLCLDVTGASKSAGVYVEQWTCNGGSNQNWSWTANGSYHTMLSQNSGLCLDVFGQGTADGTRIDQWTCNGGGNQNWSQQ